jgi:hypothetical protein
MSAGVVAVLDANPVVGEMRSGARRFWTGREEKILRTHYAAGGVEACLPLLPGRTAKSIYQRAGQLGLKTPRSVEWPKYERHTTNEHIDAAIRRVYQRAPEKGDIQRLAVAVQRPRAWVSKRAVALGLVVPRFKAPPWSAEENQILADRAGQHFRTIRAALSRAGFQRTETAISVQSKRLRISRETHDPDVYTARTLAEMFGIDSHAVTAWVEKGWLRAKKGEGVTGKWLIRRKDVRAFVVENAAAIDIRKVDKFWFVDLLAGSTALGESKPERPQLVTPPKSICTRRAG